MELFHAIELFTQVITYVMIASGVPTCMSMLKTRDTYGVPYPFFLAGTVNAVLSIAYGILVKNSTIVQINSIATFFNAFYIVSYIYASRSKSRPVSQLAVCGGIVPVVYLCITLLVAPSAYSDTLGRTLLCVTGVLLCTPLLQVKQCMDDKTGASISLVMLISGTLCSTSWFFYGYLLKDFYVYAPNLLGILVNSCMWLTIFVYGRQPMQPTHKD